MGEGEARSLVMDSILILCDNMARRSRLVTSRGSLMGIPLRAIRACDL